MKKGMFKQKHTMRYILVVGSILLLNACKSGPDYKTVRQEVVTSHDQVMADGEKAMINKMILDSLSGKKLLSLNPDMKVADTVAERRQILTLIKKLTNVDDAMMEWMHHFQADIGNKSNDEAVRYFNDEKKKVLELDALYKEALQESDAFLAKYHLNQNSKKPMHMHHDM